MSEQRDTLGILHLVKGGGTAVRDAVEQLPESYTAPLYFDRQQFCAPGLLDGVSDEILAVLVDDDAYREVVRTHRVVMGHVSSATLVRAGCTSLAIQVREPCSRVLSLYRYWQGQDEAQLDRWGNWGRTVVASAQLSLSEFLTSSSTWPAIDNALARQALGGLAAPYVDPPRWTPSPDDFGRFAQLLDIAEWSSASDEFVRRVAARIGGPPPPPLSRVNVTEVTGVPQEIDQPMRDVLDRLTRNDAALLTYLVDNGKLADKSADDLDLEFERTAARLGFTLA